MKKFLIAIMGFGFLLSCTEEDKSNTSEFDRVAMLKNYANNIIIPSYKNVQDAVRELNNSIANFESNPSVSGIENLQNRWIVAYEEWQKVSAFNVGPAAPQGLTQALQQEVATFPVSESKIDAAIETGQYNFNDFNRDARGFLALEYLLFGGIEVSNQEVLDRIQTEDFALAYIKECAANIKTRIDNVVNTWESGYLSAFTSNAGTDVGSSTSEIYNEFVKSFESIKNFKLELPLGKRPGQTQAEPQLVEAYYSGLTLRFLKAHIQSIEDIYHGKGLNGQSELGFKNYVESVTGGPALVESTLNQWEVVKSALASVPEDEPLSVQVLSNPQPMEQLATELQRHTRFFKSDMSSVLGIAITFSSGDGD